MDAIEYLTYQHREIESLFAQVETALRTKRRLWRRLADLLAVHTAIEEMIFYPAARAAGAEELLPVVFEEHFGVECVVAEIVEFGATSAQAATRLELLKARQGQHAEREERQLFPHVRARLTPGELDAVGERMANVAEELMRPGLGVRERMARRRAVA